jgi:glucoamylase
VPAAPDDPGSSPDATGRRLAYLPAALLGNGSLLVTLSARGEVERVLWPHVDGPGNVHELRIGVRRGADVTWLDEEPAEWAQRWQGEASVLRTTVETSTGRVELVDVVDPDEPVLVRRVETVPGVVVVSARPMLEGADDTTGGFVDPSTRIVVLYRRQAALAIALDGATAADVGSVGGRGDDLAHVSPLWARIEASHEGTAHVVVALAPSPFEALARAQRYLATAGDAAERRSDADARAVTRVGASTDGPPELDRLARRSVLVLEQLADRVTGGLVAAPEMDERFTASGGYGFVWPRDLAYVVLGLLAVGRHDTARAALRWLLRTQAPEGLWLHRYWTTGEPAPSWGLHQIDETGAVLLSAEAAYWELLDDELDRALWPAVRRAAELLVAFVDPSTGLPYASIDLWEQRDGQHAYSAAAVAGGLRCAALAAGRHEPELGVRYAAAATRVASAIDEHLWDPALGRHRRAVNVARMDGRGEPPGPAYDRRLPYPNRRLRSVDPGDPRLDASLLGLAWPFAPFGAGSARVRATVDAVAAGLAAPGGGLRRHEGDTYAGGHEWPIATLWLGLARRALGDPQALERALAHVCARRTPLDLLPEQVRPDGTPAWVLPLGWSHAMLLVAALPELRLIGHLREDGAGDGRGG